MSDPSRSGITRRLARVIFLQLALISVITVLGVVVAAKVVEGVMVRTALEREAEHFWERYGADPVHPLPNTDNLLGYLQWRDEPASVPVRLRDLAPGYGRVDLDGGGVLILVDEREHQGRQARLYLVFDEESVAALSFYFGVVPLSLVLIVIYFSGWFGFRQTSKAVSPLVKLANRLRRFTPDRGVELRLENLKTRNPDDEINVLVDSLNSFTARISELIERERSFTRDASHELRTPLAVISGSAELLAGRGSLDAKQRTAVERIQRTAADMDELVTALLLLARSGRVAPETGAVSINRVVEGQLEQLALTHNADEHVSITLDQQAHLTVDANEQAAKVVIGNLLRNAINYTRKGSVGVTISGSKIEVRNKGEGVSGLDRDQIFRPFVRGEGDREVTGYGVGLDIVRRLCTTFGWDVDADFSAERGMVFSLRFPSAGR